MKMTRIGALAFAVCAALSVATVADAKAAKKRMPKASVAGATLAQPAADPALARHFEAIDTDKNGQLSREEIVAWAKARHEEMRERVEDHLKAADTNADGQISKEEAQAGLPKLHEHFEFVDADGNGQVTLEEIARLHDRDALREQVAARLKAADTDGDGKLNLAETQVAFPGLAAKFAQLDRNGDGFLGQDDVMRFVGPR